MKEKELHFFGEWLIYDSALERQKGIEYLQMWQHFLLKKVPQYDVIDVKWSDVNDVGPKTSTLFLKLTCQLKAEKQVYE